MTDMEKVKIHGVPETMLQTLFARAAHSQKKEHKFYDAKAIEIVKQLDYDFSKAEKDAAMSSGVIARTILLDQMVGAFLEEHPDATVVNIACGLDTRVYRLDNGQARFTWGLKSGKELQSIVSGLTWIEDVSLVEGMKELYPVYKLLGWIQPVKNLSNKLVILRK